MLLLGSVQGWYYSQFLDKEDKDSLFDKKQKALEEVRLEKWAHQDEALQKDRNKIDKRMQEVLAWGKQPESWQFSILFDQNWPVLEARLESDPKELRKLCRTMGVKLKTGASKEELIEAVKAHHPVFRDSFVRWQREQKEQGKETPEVDAV